MTAEYKQGRDRPWHLIDQDARDWLLYDLRRMCWPPMAVRAAVKALRALAPYPDEALFFSTIYRPDKVYELVEVLPHTPWMRTRDLDGFEHDHVIDIMRPLTIAAHDAWLALGGSK